MSQVWWEGDWAQSRITRWRETWEGRSSPGGGEEGPAGLRFRCNCCHWVGCHMGLCAPGRRAMWGCRWPC